MTQWTEKTICIPWVYIFYFSDIRLAYIASVLTQEGELSLSELKKWTMLPTQAITSIIRKDINEEDGGFYNFYKTRKFDENGHCKTYYGLKDKKCKD